MRLSPSSSLFFFFFFVSTLLVAAAGEFLQPRPTVLPVPLPSAPQQLVHMSDALGALALTPTELFVVAGDGQAPPKPLSGLRSLMTNTTRAALLPGTKPRVRFCDDTGCLSCPLPLSGSSTDCTERVEAPLTGFTGLSADGAFACADRGVFQVTDTAVSLIEPTASPVRAVASYKDMLSWATNASLTLTMKGFRRTWFVSNPYVRRIKGTTSVGAMIDGNVSAMAFDADGTRLWVGSENCVNVLLVRPLSWRRLDGFHNGLPFANVTVFVPAADHGMWIATTQGLALYNYTTRHFWVFNSERYLSTAAARSTNVTALCSMGELTVLAGTKAGGLSTIALEQYTLSQKASVVDAHSSVRHNRHGLSDPAGLKTFGDASSWFPKCSDNSGLYTAKYLVALVYHYSSTGDATIRADAWNRLRALQLLHNLTGNTGFFGRTFFEWKAGEQCDFGGGRWYNSTTMPGWTVKGDTSSDEMTGHMYAYGLAFDLLCETAEEKALVAGLITRTLDWIIDGGDGSTRYPFTFVSPFTGKPTTWARWNPEYVNQNYTSRDDRGEQSLEILNFLLLGYRITGNSKYLNAFKELALTHDYISNLRDTTTEFYGTTPGAYNGDIVYFDHHLSFLNFMSIIHSLNQIDDALYKQLPESFAPAVNASMERMYSFLYKQRNALFDSTMAIARTACPRLQVADASLVVDAAFDAPLAVDVAGMVEQAVESLRELPLSMVDMPVDNSHRWDLQRDPYSPGQAANALPKYQVAGLHRWADSPFTLSGGSGMTLYSSTIYLEIYWKMFYYKLVNE